MVFFSQNLIRLPLRDPQATTSLAGHAFVTSLDRSAELLGARPAVSQWGNPAGSFFGGHFFGDFMGFGDLFSDFLVIFVGLVFG